MTKEPTAQPTSTIDEARRLIAAGISVFPTGANKKPAAWALPEDPDDPTRHPWKPYQSRLATESEVSQWWSHDGKHGIARVHGAVSGNLETMDFDCDDEATELWTKMVEDLAPGLVAKLTRIRTPRPGTQFCYRRESPPDGNQVLAEWLTADARERGVTFDTMDASKDSAKIETRGTGGYACGPGTPANLHPKNRPYEYIGGPHLSEVATITDSEHAILFQAARLFNRRPERTQHVPGFLANAGLTPWDDFDARTTWEEILESRGWTQVFKRGETGYWKRPGANGAWSATSNFEGNDLLHVFSTSAGLEANRSYSRHAFIAIMDHGGDFKACAQELYRQHYGDRASRKDDARQQSQIYQPPEPQLYTPPSPRVISEPEPPREFKLMSAKQLDEAKFEQSWLIPGVFVDGQPGGFFAPKKSLKTNVMIDLGLSLAIGGRFLGKWQVSRACRVAMLSGESGAITIRETARRIALSQGRRLSDYTGWHFNEDLPQLGDKQDVEALARMVKENEIDVLMLDPAYLMMGDVGNDAGNLFIVGKMLRQLSLICRDTKITILICHHAKRRGAKEDKFAPTELEDIAWAGFQEWVRQWFLIGRREAYNPEQGGLHKLWLSVGGSAGHSGLWGVDIEEGTSSDVGGRRWDVSVMSRSEALAAVSEQREAAAERKKEAKFEKEVRALADKAIGKLKSLPDGESVTALRKALGLNSGNKKWPLVLELLFEERRIEECEVFKNKVAYDGVCLKKETNPANATWPTPSVYAPAFHPDSVTGISLSETVM